VEGQSGWADFSARSDQWVEIDEESPDVHLRAYDKGFLNGFDQGKNILLSPLGAGQARPVIVEYPNASVDDA